MSDEQRQRAREALCAIVLETAARLEWQCVAAYVPMRTEPASLELLDGLCALGARVLVPVTLPDRDLDWTTWPPAEPPSLLGVGAIGGADAVLVPALAVAADGTRLGRGGGSYDRALTRAAPSAVVAAMVFAGETVDGLPRDPWDLPVSAVVDPGGWVALR